MCGHQLPPFEIYVITKWEEEWLMSFNPDKCEIIHISRKQKPIIFQYTLHNQILKSTNKAKYLGVTVFTFLFINLKDAFALFVILFIW
jgi:hypothetical protein